MVEKREEPEDRPTRTESEVDEASIESFPASDPPPWTPPGSAVPDDEETGTAGRKEKRSQATGAMGRLRG